MDEQVPDLQQLMEGGQPVVYDHSVSPLVLLLHTLQRVHRQEELLQSRVRRRLRFEDGPAISRALVRR